MATAKQKLTALADAVREKTGETSPLSLDAMATLISALEVGGGGLPSGWATGTFNNLIPDEFDSIYIEHGLGAVPDVVILFDETLELEPGIIHADLHINYSSSYDEETGEYYAFDTNGRMFFGASTVAGIKYNSSNSFDTDKYISFYTNSNGVFAPSHTYRWIAIKQEA